MIHFCTCSRGSASALERSRKQVGVASCKICGGKPLVDGGESLAGSMPSTVGLELTSVINTDFSWKTVSKGNRNTARRARKLNASSTEGSVKPIAGNLEEIAKGSKRVENMPVSESEKLGVSVLGRRFSDKIEHVPIKKRRFLIHPPSPPPRVPSPNAEEARYPIINRDSALGQVASPGLTVKESGMSITTAVANELREVVREDTVHGKNSIKIHVKHGNHEDFSGISILAAAACDNSIEGGAGKAEEDSLDEGTHISERTLEVPLESESCSVLEETIISSELTRGTTNNPATTSSVVEDRNDMRSPFSPNIAASVAQDLHSNKDDGRDKRLESASRDGRFHWDLNVVMDAWENPCEDPIVDTETASVHCSDDGANREKVQSETGDYKYEQASGVSVGVHKVTERPDDSKSLVSGLQESNQEVRKMDACTSFDQTPSLQKRISSMKIVNAIDCVTDLVGKTKPMCNQGRISSNDEAVVYSHAEGTQESSTLVNIAAVSDQIVSSKYEGLDNCEILSPHQDSVDVRYSCAAAVNITSKSVTEERRDETSPIDHCKQREDSCAADVALSGASSSKRVFLDDMHSEEKSDVLSDGYIPEMTQGCTQISLNCEELSTSGAYIGKGECVVVENAKLQDPKVSVMDAEGISTTEVASMNVDSVEVEHKASDQISGGVEMPIVVGSLSSHEACKSSDDTVNTSGMVAIEEDPFDDSDYESDVSHNDPVHVPEIRKATEFEEGYDSQYEDGELREPNGHNWEEAGYEGEPERVDYGSAPEDYELVQSRERNSQEAKVMDPSMHSKVDTELSAGKESNQLASSRMKLSGWDKLPEGRQSSAATIVEDREGNGSKDGVSVEMDMKDSSTRMVGSTASQRNVPSSIDGPTSSQLLLRKDSASVYVGRVEMDTSAGKSIVRGGSSLNMHGRGRGADRWGDTPRGNWDLNRHRSPSYYSPANFVLPGPQNAAAAAAAKVVSNGFSVAADGTLIKAGGICPGPSGRVQRQSVNGSTQVGHRSITRRGSPTERDDGFGIPMGLEQVTEISPGRSPSAGRSRSGRYGPRGPRERYHGSGPEDSIDSSLRLQHPLSRREHSYSPIHRRGGPHLSQSFRRSRSISRSRSPHMWASPRGRNGSCAGLRQCSRSPPNFRPETRIDRMRLPPHRRPGYGEDPIVGFSSTPRNRGSPPHSSRWVDDRKDSLGQFRENGYKHRSSVSERKSPGRVMRRSHRDLVDSSPRLRPDECYNRPMHPGRFPDMIEAGRRPRYDGRNDDKRKHGERYGMFHHGRHYHAEEPMKRFQYDVEDGFVVHSSRNKDTSGFNGRGSPKEDYARGIDNRLGDAPRRGREDKGHLRYVRDGKFNANSKSFGIRECEDDIAPRQRRPS